MSDWGGTTFDLESVPFLAAASPRAMAQVQNATRLATYSEGDIVFREGDPPSHLYVVRDGTIEIVDEIPDGSVEVLRSMGRGRLIGELGILGGHSRSATARAAEDSELWAIEREAFLEVYETEPAVALELAQTMAVYMLDAEHIAQDLLFLDLRGRLAKRLLFLSEVAGSDVRRVVETETHSREQVAGLLREASPRMEAQSFDQLERLATLAGGTRRTVAELLGGMQREGLLILAEGSIVLLDEDRLAEISQFD